MPKQNHDAYMQEYDGIPLKIITEAQVIGVSSTRHDKMYVKALWDTGAMKSAITHNLASQLNLKSIKRVKVNGVNSVGYAKVVKISVLLPNLHIVDDVNATVCNLIHGVDLLIGMDIIMIGDFCISNGGGKTLFSFAIPPFENKTNLCEKAQAVNSRKR